MMNHLDLLEQATVRLDRLIWLSAELTTEAASDAFEEFCECLPEKASDPIYETLPELLIFADDGEEPQPEMVKDYLLFPKTRRGFLAQGAHPVFTYTSETAASFSWGYYNTRWFYADNTDELTTLLVAWADALDEKAKAMWRPGNAEPSNA